VRGILVDTAGPVVGIAAFAEGELAHAADLRVAAGTEAWLGEELGVAVRAVPELAWVGVTVGPGAFTGIRVGVAAALGLAIARAVPVIPLSSLALRACLAPGEPRVLALLDARKGKVYAGWYDTRGPVPVALGEERDMLLADLAGEPPGVAVGEGASVFAPALAALGHRIVGEPDRSPVRNGLSLAMAGERRSAETVGLRYLREPDARPRQV
jgi:tRNA threonylcarbamoyladenosine biosynthesis protein TsaB